MKHFPAIVATTILLLLGTIASASDGIMVAKNSAWARATPPGSKTTAIYLTLMNHSASDISLTSVTAGISDRVELHTHISQDGLMKMQQVNAIIVPAGSQAPLKPHGHHIMVFNLQEQLKTGTEISVELTFNNGYTQSLSVPVYKESPTSDDESEDHKDMKHEHTDDKTTDHSHKHKKADS